VQGIYLLNVNIILHIWHCFHVFTEYFKQNKMKNAKLIWRANNSYLPTPHCALYFGGSDNNVYVIYQKHNKILNGIPKIEFVIDRSEEFSYDYTGSRLIDLLSEEGIESPEYYIGLDSPNHQFKPFKISGVAKTYLEAEVLLNKYTSDRTLITE